MDFDWWVMESSHFPCLDHLLLDGLSLKEIPAELGDIPTLKSLHLELWMLSCRAWKIPTSKFFFHGDLSHPECSNGEDYKDMASCTTLPVCFTMILILMLFFQFLGDILLDYSNFAVMIRYVSSNMTNVLD
ncbi:hypothetical protein SASPL_144632 [Salvia splendens]|uniref:Uncharacterized protein n=1 Tax=Salvia splendens TaxID=180675 RepID=A0A8X8WGR0_SALSN|nr:hypothetical protein SASPL_144632 [Salvia splendens]